MIFIEMVDHEINTRLVIHIEIHGTQLPVLDLELRRVGVVDIDRREGKAAQIEFIALLPVRKRLTTQRISPER